MIRVSELAKYFGGKRALGPVSFEIQDGETVGFLGLNGAGKTTALRILACDLRPSAGQVVVGDVDAVENPHAVRKQVGFLPENPPLYPDMTVRDYLAFAGRLRGMSPTELGRRIPEVLELTHLTGVHDELIRSLSHGYRQRVGVAQAVVHKPRLLVLDEPTRGLDPVQIVEMRQMIRNLKVNHTVLISSHILPEISETCDRLLVLGEGSIIARGTEDELSARLLESRRFVVVVRPASASLDDAAQAAIVDAIKKLNGVDRVSAQGHEYGALAFEVGRLLALRGAVLVCGGRGGVMEAAARGARSAGGTTVGILPGADRREGNPYLDVVVTTGMGQARNLAVVLSGDALVAIGGEFGTLSEIALALKHGVPVVGLRTWRLEGAAPAGTPPRGFHAARDAEEAVELALRLGRQGRAPGRADE